MSGRERAGAAAIGAIIGGMCALLVCFFEKVFSR